MGRADRGEQVALRVQIMAVAASQRSCTLHGIAMSGDDAVILALSSS